MKSCGSNGPIINLSKSVRATLSLLLGIFLTSVDFKKHPIVCPPIKNKNQDYSNSSPTHASISVVGYILSNQQGERNNEHSKNNLLRVGRTLMLEQIFCPHCASAQQVVDAQWGQNQYVKCGINVSPCCSGEQASDYEIDDVVSDKKITITGKNYG